MDLRPVATLTLVASLVIEGREAPLAAMRDNPHVHNEDYVSVLLLKTRINVHDSTTAAGGWPTASTAALDQHAAWNSIPESPPPVGGVTVTLEYL
jgi:hypothetical protein